MYSLRRSSRLRITFLFFFNDTATTEIYTLSLHDALPIWRIRAEDGAVLDEEDAWAELAGPEVLLKRSEEHTSELQSHSDLVCRLLLEKKKKKKKQPNHTRTQVKCHIREE